MNLLIIYLGPKQLSASFLEMKSSEESESMQVQEQCGSGVWN